MFEALSSKLNGVFDRLRRRGALSEADVQEALREVRVALLEADVALPVVKDLTARVRELPTDRDLLVYCRGPFCLMAIEGVQRLRALDLPARRLRFSVPEWKAAGLPIDSA